MDSDLIASNSDKIEVPLVKEINKAEGDSVIILSSDLIASVMQSYFNDTMFKIPVEVVDLQPSASGYAFTLAFQSVPIVDYKHAELKPLDTIGCVYCETLPVSVIENESLQYCSHCGISFSYLLSHANQQDSVHSFAIPVVPGTRGLSTNDSALSDSHLAKQDSDESRVIADRGSGAFPSRPYRYRHDSDIALHTPLYPTEPHISADHITAEEEYVSGYIERHDLSEKEVEMPVKVQKKRKR